MAALTFTGAGAVKPVMNAFFSISTGATVVVEFSDFVELLPSV